MEDTKIQSVMSCPACRGAGTVGLGRCSTCHGMIMGKIARGKWLYWGVPLDRFHLRMASARRAFNRFRFATVFTLALTCFLWAGLLVYLNKLYLAIIQNPTAFLLTPTRSEGVVQTFLWLGLGFTMYLWYRSIRERSAVALVERYDYKASGEEGVENTITWDEAVRFPHSKRRNIAKTFTAEAHQAIARAYEIADANRSPAVNSYHVLQSLLSSTRISNIFIRLGFGSAVVERAIKEIADRSAVEQAGAEPMADEIVKEALFAAYQDAYRSHQEYVGVVELFAATVRLTPAAQELFFDIGIETPKLMNVVEWARIREKMYRDYQRFRGAAAHRSTSGMDRAMTAVATPFLNRFSDDVTLLAQFGQTDVCVAREKEIEQVFRIIDGGQENVLLVGDYGVGKRSIVEGIAQKMVVDDVPKRLHDKRLVRLSTSSLLAGTTPAGAVERLIRIMNEIGRAGNIILFIHNIHELMGVAAGTDAKSLDLASTLSEYVASGRFMTIATATTEAYAQLISNSKLSTVFSKVEVPEMDGQQTIQVLESRVGYVEYKQQVFFAYSAIEKAAELCARYVHDVTLPGSAIEIVSEAGSFVRAGKGVNSLVTGEDVSKVIAEKTKIPVTTVTADESAKLLHLEEEMHRRVVGQYEAVTMVANALRRARAQISSAKRPIANFLFLGPTGVGKTELAKTIAEVYFGGEERMIRLDMSEYQDKQSVYRLIGTPGQKGSGILTEAVRQNPFALLLLDEIEKADKDILNLFLQVMDDGRLTDSTGRVVDFTSVILVATSNAGTRYVQDQLNQGLSSEIIKDRLLHGELKDYFRPEFLNRFDGIVLFRALDREAVKKIAEMMLARVGQDLEKKGITLAVAPEALDFLVDIGFDPEFGARPMRRALQERVESGIAELLLSGSVKRKDTVVVGEGGKLSVRN